MEAQRRGDTRERWNGGERHGGRDRERQTQRSRRNRETGRGRWRWSETRGGGVLRETEPASQECRSCAGSRGPPGGGAPSRRSQPRLGLQGALGDHPQALGSLPGGPGAPLLGGGRRSRAGEGSPLHLGHSILTLALGGGLLGSLCLSLPPVHPRRLPRATSGSVHGPPGARLADPCPAPGEGRARPHEHTCSHQGSGSHCHRLSSRQQRG